MKPQRKAHKELGEGWKYEKKEEWKKRAMSRNREI